jgi:hypothetical protein
LSNKDRNQNKRTKKMSEARTAEIRRLSFDLSSNLHTPLSETWLTDNPFCADRISELYRSHAAALTQSLKAEYKTAVKRFELKNKALLRNPELAMARLCYFHAGFDFDPKSTVEETIRRLETAIADGAVTRSDTADEIQRLRFEWNRYQQLLRGVIGPEETRFDNSHRSKLSDTILNLDWTKLWSNDMWLTLDRADQISLNFPRLGHVGKIANSSDPSRDYTQKKLNLRDVPLRDELNGLEVECTLFVKEIAQRAIDAVAREDFSTRHQLFVGFANHQYKLTVQPVVDYIRKVSITTPVRTPPSIRPEPIKIPPLDPWIIDRRRASRGGGGNGGDSKDPKDIAKETPPLSTIAKSVYYYYWKSHSEYSDRLVTMLEQMIPIKTDLVGICNTEKERGDLDRSLRKLFESVRSWNGHSEEFASVDNAMLVSAHDITHQLMMEYIKSDGGAGVSESDMKNTNQFMKLLSANTDVMEREFPPLKRLNDASFVLWKARDDVRIAASDFVAFCEGVLQPAGEKEFKHVYRSAEANWAFYKESDTPWGTVITSRTEDLDDFQRARRILIDVLHHVFIGNLQAFQELTQKSVLNLDKSAERKELPSDAQSVQTAINAAEMRMEAWRTRRVTPSNERREGGGGRVDSKHAPGPKAERKTSMPSQPPSSIDYAISCELGGAYSANLDLDAKQVHPPFSLKGLLGLYLTRIEKLEETTIRFFKETASDVILLSSCEADQNLSGCPSIPPAVSIEWLALVIYYDFLANINSMRRRTGQLWIETFAQYEGMEEEEANATRRRGHSHHRHPPSLEEEEMSH